MSHAVIGARPARGRVTAADPRWAAVLARDPVADGAFVYAVRTTGVYCHPSDPSRRPRPENVEFFANAAAAEAAGYRPSRRRTVPAAQRSAHHAAIVAHACRTIAAAAAMPTLRKLARDVGLSRYHFHRIFKAATGLTPRAYAAAERARRVRAALPTSRSVTDALYAAGYPSNSRFYAQADAALGMAPARFRSGGAATDIYFAVAQCSLGALLVAQSSRGVCAILLGDSPQALVQDLQDRFAQANLIGADAGFERLVAQVVGFIEAPQQGLDLPLDVRGTVFQLRVWDALRAIPPGTTVSYGELARRIGAPAATRAVARACAANTLAVAIPCHRVVRTDGTLSGYRWGVERKRELLRREAGAAGLPADQFAE